MTKAYYILFYKLYRFFKSLSDDSWGTWKALLVICVTEGFIVLTVGVGLKVIFKESPVMEMPMTFWGIFCVALTIVNYLIFLHKDRWKNYEDEFKNYPIKKSRIYGWLVFLFLLLVLSSLIFAFYQMSRIDWSKYNPNYMG